MIGHGGVGPEGPARPDVPRRALLPACFFVVQHDVPLRPGALRQCRVRENTGEVHAGSGPTGTMKECSSMDGASMMRYAQKVIIVRG